LPSGKKRVDLWFTPFSRTAIIINVLTIVFLDFGQGILTLSLFAETITTIIKLKPFNNEFVRIKPKKRHFRNLVSV